MIGQLKPAYVYNLNMYLKYLEQRNNYLKQIKTENKSDEMLEIWNEKLAEYAEKVYNYRIKFVNQIKEKINPRYESITRVIGYGNLIPIQNQHQTVTQNQNKLSKTLDKLRKIV